MSTMRFCFPPCVHTVSGKSIVLPYTLSGETGLFFAMSLKEPGMADSRGLGIHQGDQTESISQKSIMRQVL